jgi:hypothetical protein
MEGYVWVVIDTDGVEVQYQMMDTEEGLDSNDESEVGSEEEVVQLIMEREGGSVPDIINDQHQLNSDQTS